MTWALAGRPLTDANDSMADLQGLSLYQLVLAAALMHPAIQVAICGIKTPE